VVAALRRFLSLPRLPGTAFCYSNAGYVCLALAVERAAGQPLPDFARRHLFGPLGMC
jgi:CubicO group peptidase (beta-lactamase class C family)